MMCSQHLLTLWRIGTSGAGLHYTVNRRLHVLIQQPNERGTGKMGRGIFSASFQIWIEQEGGYIQQNTKRTVPYLAIKSRIIWSMIGAKMV